MRPALRRAGLLLAGGLGGCATAPVNGSAAHQFLEHSYVGLVPSDTSLLYEAHAATHIVVVDGQDSAWRALEATPTRRTAGAWQVAVTPMFRVRQLRDSSAAVRTPSFMPRISVQHAWITRRNAVDSTATAAPITRARILGARFSLTHHSNGQAGCFREGFVPVDARASECVAAPGADTMIVALNRANGDFSSTFVSGLWHGTLLWRGDTYAPRFSLGAGIGGDWHPRGLFGALSDEQRALYGSWRARVLGEGLWDSGPDCGDRTRGWCLLRGRTRVAAEWERAPSDPGALARRISPAVLPWRASLELSHALDGLRGAGLIVRWHDGQDDYNIGFVRRRRAVLYGVVLDLSGRPRLGS